MLTPEQIASFHDRGFLIGLPLLTGEQAAQIRGHLGRRRVGERLLRSLATHPAVLSAVKSLLGPDVLIRNADVFIKRPRCQPWVHWHVDTLTEPGAAAGMVNAWIALTETHRWNGCLRYLPGRHRSRLPEEVSDDPKALTFTSAQRAALPLEEEAVLVELAAGQLALHAYRTPHASGTNFTRAPRIGFAVRYFAARLSREEAECGQAFLASGRAPGWSQVKTYPIGWKILPR